MDRWLYKEHRRDRALLEMEMKKEKFRRTEENSGNLTRISADNEKQSIETNGAGVTNAAFVSEHL